MPGLDFIEALLNGLARCIGHPLGDPWAKDVKEHPHGLDGRQVVLEAGAYLLGGEYQSVDFLGFVAAVLFAHDLSLDSTSRVVKCIPLAAFLRSIPIAPEGRPVLLNDRQVQAG